jgi:Plasmid stabilization system protein
MRVEYTWQVRTELRAIRDYIAKDNPAAAQRVVSAIEAEIELLACFPWNGRKTDEQDVLGRTLSRYPYIVFYRVETDVLIIVHVLHAARRHPGFQETAFEFVPA